MPLYDNLPVYHAAYAFLKDLVQICTKLSRDYRYTIGEEVKKQLLEIVVDVYNANNINGKTQRKFEIVDDACQRMVKIKIYMRLLNDLKQISTKSFARQAFTGNYLSMQLNNWRNSLLPESVQG